MAYRGIVRGNVIELDRPPPFAEGETVDVEIASAAEPRRGSAAAVLAAVRRPPHLDSADVDELERLIREGRLPLSDGRLFDEDPPR